MQGTAGIANINLNSKKWDNLSGSPNVNTNKLEDNIPIPINNPIKAPNVP